MNFLSSGIGRILSEKLASAAQVKIASAFFSPSDAMLCVLQDLQRLDLVISEEFTINDPYKLCALKNANLRSVPTDDDKGKLHAKVFIVGLKDGKHWVLMGSANLTQQGLFANQEACVALDSTNVEDAPAVRRVIAWFDGLFAASHRPNLTAAKEIFDQRSRYRLEPRPTDDIDSLVEYWAIKTTSGGADGEEHWPRLLKEGVVAIGWEELDVDPSTVNDDKLRHSLAQILDPEKPGSVDFGVRTIRNFINMPVGSIIVLCRGLVPQQSKPVHVYAFARVTGPFFSDPQNGTQWRFKRKAVIQRIDAALSASTFSKAVDKESFRQTMHRISPEVVERLADALNVPIEV